jgi:hypothetical protein
MVQASIQQAYAAQLRQFYREAASAAQAPNLTMGQSWPLAHCALPSLRQPEHRAGLPAALLEAHDFYVQQIAAQDLGSVHGVTLRVGEQMTFAIAVTTDGDDGWLEIYARDGTLLAAGRSYLDQVLWAERDEVRAWTQTAALPPALAAMGPDQTQA